MAMDLGFDSHRVGDIRRLIEQTVAERLDAGMKAMEERFQHMEERGTVGPQDVRMSCVALVVKHAAGPTEAEAVVTAADVMTQYVLTGKKPGEA
jgi:hypothetical protein